MRVRTSRTWPFHARHEQPELGMDRRLAPVCGRFRHIRADRGARSGRRRPNVLVLPFHGRRHRRGRAGTLPVIVRQSGAVHADDRAGGRHANVDRTHCGRRHLRAWLRQIARVRPYRFRRKPQSRRLRGSLRSAHPLVPQAAFDRQIMPDQCCHFRLGKPGDGAFPSRAQTRHVWSHRSPGTAVSSRT